MVPLFMRLLRYINLFQILRYFFPYIIPLVSLRDGLIRVIIIPVRNAEFLNKNTACRLDAASGVFLFFFVNIYSLIAMLRPRFDPRRILKSSSVASLDFATTSPPCGKQ